MLNNKIQELIEKKLTKVLKERTFINKISNVGGGDINVAYRIHSNKGDYFVKLNSSTRYPQMFIKEKNGLDLLRSANEIRIPRTIATDETGSEAFLILEFLKSATMIRNFWTIFGTQLARLHKHSEDYFGLGEDNYIGSLHQSNRKHSNWANFFIEERLEQQIKLARDGGRINRETIHGFERLYKRLDEIFPEEPSSLVHGDLWSGNFMIDNKGYPCLIDPAVYFGHREMDLGMSKLFGGFASEFYDAYNKEYPVEKGWESRLEICNLYPLMVHVNLFGGGYTGSVMQILRRFK